MGLKGRYREELIEDDHLLTNATYPVDVWNGSSFKTKQKPALTALNERLRNDYYEECSGIVDTWNGIIREHEIDFELRLPHHAFHRAVGSFANLHFTPSGQLIDDAAWSAQKDNWLPTDEDQAFVTSLMEKPVHQPGKFANWIAPPPRGLNRLPLDFEYVRVD